jgi:hypothetical protein
MRAVEIDVVMKHAKINTLYNENYNATQAERITIAKRP